MRHLHRSVLAGIGLLFSSYGYAYTINLYADALYWQPSESVDWALTNSNISSTVQPNQTISYKTIDFDYSPGFRLGAGIDTNDWTTRLLYTRYNTRAIDSTTGNVISTFMPSKFSSKFYSSAHINFSIDLNMLDLDLAKEIKVSENLLLSPYVGIKGGWIDQAINTQYQNPISVPPTNYNPNNVTERVNNNFSGIGPKIGLSGLWQFYNKNNVKWGLVGDFAASFLWGKWGINDTLHQDNAGVIGSVTLGSRNFGSFVIEGLVGIHLDYKNASLKLAYEVSDWFNQYQVFDNGSGTHTNDLVLQGLTLGLTYHFNA